MPTVRGIPGPHRYFFYSIDCNEPAHVHVRRDDVECKFWLDPVLLADNYGMRAHELARVRDSILNHYSAILEAWREHCRKRDR
jgi:hypothetical protein